MPTRPAERSRSKAAVESRSGRARGRCRAAYGALGGSPCPVGFPEKRDRSTCVNFRVRTKILKCLPLSSEDCLPHCNTDANTVGAHALPPGSPWPVSFFSATCRRSPSFRRTPMNSGKNTDLGRLDDTLLAGYTGRYRTFPSTIARGPRMPGKCPSKHAKAPGLSSQPCSVPKNVGERPLRPALVKPGDLYSYWEGRGQTLREFSAFFVNFSRSASRG
jgi:hypothetical protein